MACTTPLPEYKLMEETVPPGYPGPLQAARQWRKQDGTWVDTRGRVETVGLHGGKHLAPPTLDFV